MSSMLPELYTAIEGMAVSYTNKSGAATNPNCYGLSEIPASVETAELPCRILLPVGQGVSGSPTVSVLRSPNVQAQWNITDLFLLEAAARDAGLYVQAPVLVRYVAAYAEALGKKFNPTSNYRTSTLAVSANITPGMYEYPSGSGSWFYGVKCDLVFDEIF